MGSDASQTGQGKTRIDRPDPKETTGLCSAEVGVCLQVVLSFRRGEAHQPSSLTIAVEKRGYTALGWSHCEDSSVIRRSEWSPWCIQSGLNRGRQLARDDRLRAETVC